MLLACPMLKYLTAKERGYVVDGNRNIVIGPKGRVKPVLKGDRLFFKIKLKGKTAWVSLHRYVMFCKHGNRVFKLLVRHLDGNPLNNSDDNLKLGTESDNMMDIKQSIRILKATKASRSQARYRGEPFWRRVRVLNKSGVSYRALSKRFKVSKGTISYQLNKTFNSQSP
jgi:HNH endonuclease